MEQWLEGWLNVIDVLDGDYEGASDDVDYRYPRTVKEVKDMLHYLSAWDVIAYDTETASLDPFDNHSLLLATSFSAEKESGYAFPLEHPESWFDDDEIDEIMDLLCEFFMAYQGVIVGHNIKFDWQHTSRNIGCEIKSGADTMLINAMLDNRKGVHGLKRLAGLYLGMYDYDKELTDYCKAHPEANVYRGGTYAKVPLRILLPYAAMDTDATLQILNIRYPELSDAQKILHDQLLIQASDVLARMEYNGFAMDDFVANRYLTIYNIVSDDIKHELLEDKDIQKFIKDMQTVTDLCIIADAFDIPMKGDWEVQAKKKKYKVVDNCIYILEDLPNSRKSKKRKRKIFEYNPNSDFHYRDILFRYKGANIKEAVLTDTGLPSVSKDNTMRFLHDYPIIKDIQYWKMLTNMVSKYLGPATNKEWHSDDGRIRCNYNMHVAKTGRISSSEPNLQNIPAPEKEPGTLLEQLPIKNIFTHTYPGGGLMSADYSGMELRIMASVSKCINMLQAFFDEKDVHSMVALFATDNIPLADVTHKQIAVFRKYHKPIRYKFKWTNWTLLFGGSAWTLHNLYDIPMDECDMLVEKYFEAFPEILDFHSDIKCFAEEHGYIESAFGRKLKLSYINDTREHVDGLRKKDLRTALNMPIQSPASDILLSCLVVLQDKLNKLDMKSMLVNTVHDSIVIDYHPDEVHEVAAMCVDVMENIKEYSREYFPGIDYSWLICPLKADIEVGSHYGNEIPYATYCEELKL